LPCHGVYGCIRGWNAAHFGVHVDILTGTLGKAQRGGIGGYVAGDQPLIDLLRQRARPYLFSNSFSPSIVAVQLAAIQIV